MDTSFVRILVAFLLIATGAQAQTYSAVGTQGNQTVSGTKTISNGAILPGTSGTIGATHLGGNPASAYSTTSALAGSGTAYSVSGPVNASQLTGTGNFYNSGTSSYAASSGTTAVSGSLNGPIVASGLSSSGSTAAANAAANYVYAKNVNVKLFGAVGDGVADDTSAIQAALSATTGAVYIPAGNYKVGPLTLAKDTYVFGDGATSSLKFAVSATGACINSGTLYTLKVSDLDFDGGSNVTGSGTAGGTRSAIQVWSSNSGAFVSHCTIHGFSGVGVQMFGTVTGLPLIYGPRILENDIYYNGIGISTGITTADAEYSVISGNAVRSCGTGIMVHSGNTVVSNNTVTQNGYGVIVDIYSNPAHGVIEGNLINHADTWGIIANATGQGEIITGNQLLAADVSLTGPVSFSHNNLYVSSTIGLAGAGGVFSDNWIQNTPPSPIPVPPTWRFANNFIGNVAKAVNDQSSIVLNGQSYYDSNSGTLSVNGPLLSPTNLISNGSFASGTTSWGFIGGAWSISGTTAHTTGDDNSYLTQTISVSDTTQYLVEYTVTNDLTAGSTYYATLWIGIGGAGGYPVPSGKGYHSVIITTPVSTQQTIFFGTQGGGAWNITNLSVKQILAPNGGGGKVLATALSLSGTGSTAMTGDGSGLTNINKFSPSLRAYQSGTQTIPDSTNTTVSFPSSDTNVTFPSSDYNTSTGVWTPSKAGTYYVIAQIQVNSNVTGPHLHIMKNGNSGEFIATKQLSASSSGDTITVSGVVYMNGSTDTLNVMFSATPGVVLTGYQGTFTFFSGFFVH
jgi:parallel beta-helix repeat protein